MLSAAKSLIEDRWATSAISNIAVLMGKEVRDSQRNRWFLMFAVVFTGLALGLSLLGFSGLGTFGVAGFGRTVASLINLVVVITPLMGLLLGAISISGERERGSLLPLLAQPVTPTEVLLGKFFGTAASLAAAILLGFGLSGIVIAWHGGLAQLGDYLMLVGLTLLLGLVHLGIGFCLSAVISKSTTALSVALILWLSIVFLSDLGLIGTAIVLRLSPQTLLGLALLNPAQVFKLAAIQMIQGNLELLGAAGLYAADVFGDFLLPVLMALLTLWILIPLGIAIGMFPRKGIQ